METFFELIDSAFTDKEFIAETGRFLYVYNSTTYEYSFTVLIIFEQKSNSVIFKTDLLHRLERLLV